MGLFSVCLALYFISIFTVISALRYGHEVGRALKRSSLTVARTRLEASKSSKSRIPSEPRSVKDSVEAIERDLGAFLSWQLSSGGSSNLTSSGVRPSEILGAGLFGALASIPFSDHTLSLLLSASASQLIARQDNQLGQLLRSIGAPLFYTLSEFLGLLSGANSSAIARTVFTLDSYTHFINTYRVASLESLLQAIQNTSDLNTRRGNLDVLERFVVQERRYVQELIR